MKHKHFTILLAMLMSIVSSVASAHSFEVDGIFYNITSSLTVAVTCQGDAYYSYSNEYTGNVTIPETVKYNNSTYSVTSIDLGAFKECSLITSVTIPDGVTSIGTSAFYDCSSLTYITLGNGVTSIGNEAFYGCSSLTSITVPDGVTSIGQYTFYNCSSLTSITLPDGVTFTSRSKQFASWNAEGQCFIKRTRCKIYDVFPAEG